MCISCKLVFFFLVDAEVTVPATAELPLTVLKEHFLFLYLSSLHILAPVLRIYDHLSVQRDISSSHIPALSNRIIDWIVLVSGALTFRGPLISV